MSYVIHLDLGPGQLAYPTQIDGKMVCVLSPRIAADRVIQARVRRFMTAQGRDCGSCGACPAGQAS